MAASIKLSESQMIDLYAAAKKAGLEAAEKCQPRPMTVVERAVPLGDVLGMSDEENPIVRSYGPYADGVCGFAWVNVRPGTSRFARWLVKKGLGRGDSYYGGVTIWIGEHNQSYEKKMAHAQAMAQVFKDAEVKAYASGRLD